MIGKLLIETVTRAGCAGAERSNMELTDTQLREKFQQWGKSSGVITDFAKCAPLPVSGARLYSRETNIAWQAFRDAYWSGHREAVLASIPEPGALTFTLDETRQICAALMPPPSYHVMQRIINAVLA